MTERGTPLIVVVGAATRDLDVTRAVGWRIGGGATYAALVLASLGLPVGAVLGADAEAAGAPELDLLRVAGVDLELVPLGRGPIFELVEAPAGRRVRFVQTSDPVPVEALPPTWRSAPGWLFAPVADEVPDAWAAAPPPTAIVGLGWQGLLREPGPGGWVVGRAVRPSPILGRADVVGVSAHDVPVGAELADLTATLEDGAVLVLTRGANGGLIVTADAGRPTGMRSYPALPATHVDATGAGDAFLAAFLAARLEPRLVGGRTTLDWQARLGAAVSALIVEGVGLAAVPDRAAVRRRLAASIVPGGADPP
jgi:sugar/nucleoside kinase (ribokinase family)